MSNSTLSSLLEQAKAVAVSDLGVLADAGAVAVLSEFDDAEGVPAQWLQAALNGAERGVKLAFSALEASISRYVCGLDSLDRVRCDMDWVARELVSQESLAVAIGCPRWARLAASRRGQFAMEAAEITALIDKGALSPAALFFSDFRSPSAFAVERLVGASAAPVLAAAESPVGAAH